MRCSGKERCADSRQRYPGPRLPDGKRRVRDHRRSKGEEGRERRSAETNPARDDINLRSVGGHEPAMLRPCGSVGVLFCAGSSTGAHRHRERGALSEIDFKMLSEKSRMMT